jgi:hypothetical protein
VAGDAVGQLQAPGTQPGFFGATELRDAFPGADADEDGGQSDDEDVAEQMVIAEGRVTRVRDVGEMVGNIQTMGFGGQVRHARFS